MQVYIEYVVIDNFIIDFILLKSACKVAKVKTTLARLIISSCMGTAVAIVLPLLKIAPLYLFIVKVLLGFLLSLISIKHLNAKKYFVLSGSFFFLTFLMGGAIIALFHFANVDYKQYFLKRQGTFLPLGVTILAVYVFSLLIDKLVSYFFTERDVLPFLRKCVVVINGKKIVVNGYVDSGNQLYDDFSGLPVIIASKKFIEKLYKIGELPSKYRTMKVGAVTGEGIIKIFEIQKLMIYNGVKVNIYNNVLMGEGLLNFYDGCNYELLLHPSLF